MILERVDTPTRSRLVTPVDELLVVSCKLAIPRLSDRTDVLVVSLSKRRVRCFASSESRVE
jgi:hypothetical protein